MIWRVGRRTRGRLHATAGFGLLEAIVALALLAGSGLALFSWIQQNMQAASRLKQHDLEARLMLSAQSLVETVNPMLQPQGAVVAGDLRVQWKSEAIEPERRNQAFAVGVSGPFRIGLYRLDVHASDLRLGTEAHFEQWQIGMQRDAVLPASPL
jgi:general secretion pathway protein I